VNEWDTRALAVRQLDLPPALGYEWLRGDTLIATDPFPPAASNALASTGAAGDPTGGQRFGMWRTGFLSEINATSCQVSGAGDTSAASGPYTLLDLRTTAWSPDGRYLLTISTTARGSDPPPPAVTAPLSFCVSGPLASALPVTPIHDRATRAALALLGGAITQVDLLWSPDGKRLAALPYSVSQLPNTIIIYDTATGAILSRIAAGSSEIPGAQGSDASAQFVGGAWAPDSQRFLAAVAGHNFNIRIYNAHALG
jgi:hypothetical protein